MISLKEKYPNAIFIITDCRFPNEIKAIHQHGGLILDVQRDDLYIKEKQLIRRFGVNLFSKLLMKKINPALTDPSEWNYFFIQEKNSFPIINNTDLQRGMFSLEDFVQEAAYHLRVKPVCTD